MLRMMHYVSRATRLVYANNKLARAFGSTPLLSNSRHQITHRRQSNFSQSPPTINWKNYQQINTTSNYLKRKPFFYAHRAFSQPSWPSPWRQTPRRTPGQIVTRNGYAHFNQNRGLNITPMLRNILVISGLGTSFYIYSNLDYAPFTGRTRILGVSQNYEIAMGKHAYNEVLDSYSNRILPPNHPQVIRVKRMIKRIANTATNLDPSVGKGFEWTVNIVQDNTPNALCTPGGRILVTTGMIQLMRDDDELAMILAHETAHALNRHGAESMHLQRIAFPFFVLMDIILGIRWLPALLMKLTLSLPYSRKLELEADAVGLLLCAEACYDPQVAPRVFQKLAAVTSEAPGGTIRSSLSTFVSTHPQSSERARKLEKQLPERVDRYTHKCSIPDRFVQYSFANQSGRRVDPFDRNGKSSQFY